MKKKFLSAVLVLAVVSSISATTVFGASDTEPVTIHAIIDPTITLSINNTTVDFGHVDPTTTNHDLEDAVVATISSNTNYKLEALATQPTFSTLGGDTFPISKLNIKSDSKTGWLTVDNVTPAVLFSDGTAGENKTYNVDFRLITDYTIKPGEYTATVNLTASTLTS